MYICIDFFRASRIYPECHRSLEPDGEADSVSYWPE